MLEFAVDLDVSRSGSIVCLRECCRGAVGLTAPGGGLVAAAGSGQHGIAWWAQAVERRECR